MLNTLRERNMVSRFSEQQTESYYDSQDVTYQLVWDEDGSVHWGLFNESGDKDFLKACDRLNRTMAEKGCISQDSSVLDLGCGNGLPPSGWPARAAQG